MTPEQYKVFCVSNKLHHKNMNLSWTHIVHKGCYWCYLACFNTWKHVFHRKQPGIICFTKCDTCKCCYDVKKNYFERVATQWRCKCRLFVQVIRRLQFRRVVWTTKNFMNPCDCCMFVKLAWNLYVMPQVFKKRAFNRNHEKQLQLELSSQVAWTSPNSIQKVDAWPTGWCLAEWSGGMPIDGVTAVRTTMDVVCDCPTDLVGT